MKRIALLFALVVVLGASVSAQTYYSIGSIREYADTATTAWQALTLPKTALARAFVKVEINLIAGGKLAWALSASDTANAFRMEAWNQNSVIDSVSLPVTFIIDQTYATTLFVKSMSTSDYRIKVW
jgi:hypothetical protein